MPRPTPHPLLFLAPLSLRPRGAAAAAAAPRPPRARPHRCAMSSAARPSALVTPRWLRDNLASTTVLDASWHMPSAARSAAAEHAAARVPGAARFDIDAPGLCDAAAALPHMLPSARAFAAAAAALGVRNHRPAVVYAQAGFVAAARAWWMLRVFGKDDVFVLDGGLNAWREAGFQVESGPEREPLQGGEFEVRMRPELLSDMNRMVEMVNSAEGVILDARSQGRFDGTAPEPRPGLLSGHMPGSFCLPSGKVVTEHGTIAGPERVWEALKEAGVSEERVRKGPVSISCGSGVTAAIDALALHEVGIDAAVYDGSWSEYGSHHDNPVEKA